jgi:tetraacyldisaccharide-1-P 4'-kinase
VHTKLAFPDHYKFSKSEIQKMIDESFKNNLELVTTEKDYFRIKHYGFQHIKFLKIKLEILEKDKLINQILNYS